MLCLGSSALVESINVCFKLQVPIPHPKCLGGRADFGFDILGTRHHTNYLYFRHESCTHTLHIDFIQYLLLCLCFYCNVSYEARSRFPICVSALRFWILEDSQLVLPSSSLFKWKVSQKSSLSLRRSPSLTTLSIPMAARHFWPLNSVRHTQMLPLFFVCGSSSVMF